MDVDLLIEMLENIDNFLLWQIAYAELYWYIMARL
jgi:undecaprenyl pyrophosphate synthase